MIRKFDMALKSAAEMAGREPHLSIIINTFGGS